MNKNTPMHTALFNDRFEIAKLLIAHHADVNAREDYKRRPLHLAASRNSVETAKLLIAYHADSVNAREDYKRTPLHTAASSNSIKTAKLLIAHHADVNARGYLDHEGRQSRDGGATAATRRDRQVAIVNRKSWAPNTPPC